jgi:hypothetical protein
MSKQTAIEWLFKKLFDEPKDKLTWYAILEQAKEMEKQQIKGAWLSAWKDSMINPLQDKYYEPEAEQYYNETYKSE